jgi:RND family efflux transporter MFP subunit
MKKYTVFLVAGIAGLLAFSCKGDAEASKSMEQIYAEEGYPVQTRTVTPEPFSVFLKYPAEFKARSQSSVYAKTSDVIRSVDFKVGDYVKRDEVVLSFSTNNSAYQQAKASFENSQATYTRMNTLYEAGAISRQDFENTRTQYILARETFKAADELIRIKAPIDGYITQLNVQASVNVRAGDALFTVSNQDGFEADFYVLPNEIDNIQVNARVFVEGRNETIEGRITEVSLMMDVQKKAFPVKAFFAGKPRTLVSGMSVDAAVEVYQNNKALTVSRNELTRSGESWTIFLIEDGKAVQETVVLGQTQGFDYEILDGLAEGDTIISDGLVELNDGAKVKIIAPLLSQVN